MLRALSLQAGKTHSLGQWRDAERGAQNAEVGRS